MRGGFSYNTSRFSIITIHNDGNDNLQIDYEMNGLEATMGSNSGVEIVNNPTIQKIIDPIDFEANVTFNEGTVHVITPTQIADKSDVTVNAKVSGKIADANPNRKALLIQVLSESKTELRIGSDNVSATRGIYVAGSKAAPAVIPIETTAEIHAFNDTDGVQAVLSVTEVLK